MYLGDGEGAYLTCEFMFYFSFSLSFCWNPGVKWRIQFTTIFKTCLFSTTWVQEPAVQHMQQGSDWRVDGGGEPPRVLGEWTDSAHDSGLLHIAFMVWLKKGNLCYWSNLTLFSWYGGRFRAVRPVPPHWMPSLGGTAGHHNYDIMTDLSNLGL